MDAPNVRRVRRAEYVKKLDENYRDALASARAANLESEATRLLSLIATSHAVICRSVEQTVELCQSDRNAHLPYGALLHAGVRIPDGGDWAHLRGVAGAILFGEAASPLVHCAALSLGELGPSWYGDVSWQLGEAYVGHRATVFVSNSALFFSSVGNGGIAHSALGLIALWRDRAKLALVKHVRQLAPGMRDDAFQSLIFHATTRTWDDVFLEAHIYGRLTRHSL